MLGLAFVSLKRTLIVDLLALAKNVADRVEAAAAEARVPVAVCVMDTHGKVVLTHRMKGAPVPHAITD